MPLHTGQGARGEHRPGLGRNGRNPQEAQSSAQKSSAEAITVLQLRLGAQRRLLFSNSYFLIRAWDRKTLNARRTEVTDSKTPHFNTPELL